MISLNITGRYQDTIITKDEYGNETREVRPWEHNQVQDSALKIIAHGLELSSNLSDYFPLKYMALGTGTSNTQDVTEETLETEVERVELPGSITYLDNNGVPLNPQVPSNRFKVTVTLGGVEGNGHTLTEFGLVGGNATMTVDSGYLFNWIRHEPIIKTPQITVERVVDITLGIDRS